MHEPFREIAAGLIRSAPFDEATASPNQLRWRPLPIPKEPTDFVAGLVTMGGNGDPAQQTGAAVHLYAANASMVDRFFYDADGELLIVPQQGALTVRTELGVLHVAPSEFCVVPRGVKFRVEVDGPSRGYVCENYGAHFRLPELGPIGTSGLANSRDFLSPVAAFEERDGDFRVVAKFLGKLWEAKIDHSPLDIVAWHGTYVPYKYDLKRFNTINTVSYDHPDPSIFTVLTAPTATAGTANIDFGVIADRWSVAREHVPAAAVSPQRVQRVRRPRAGPLHRQGRRLRARLRELAQLDVGARARQRRVRRGLERRRTSRSTSPTR